MSYRRFANTKGKVDDCLDAIRRDETLSDSEVQIGKSMFRGFLTFCRENDIIEGYDGEVLDEIFEGLRKKENDDE